MINQTISHYKIIEKIGSGGMGDIYKAQDLKLERFVALKFLPQYLCRDETEKKRFIREAKAASATEHENICTIYEIGETEDGQVFIAMAYYEGETLKEKLERGPLPVKEAINIAIKVAQGLERVHENGVIHRDIKPSNIMITNRSEVKILDFGLAKVAGGSQLTRTDATLGTIAYMSPEQARGDKVDHRSDIWSLGVVLYEMLAGDRPFRGEHSQAVVYSILNEDPKHLSSIKTEVPKELATIVSKLLAKKSDTRYQNVKNLISDLLRFISELDSSGNVKFSEQLRRKENKKLLRRFSKSTGIMFVLILLLFLAWSQFFKKDLLSEPITIAVVSFENQTGDKSYDYLQNAIPNLLITDLEQFRYFRVTSWERIYDLLKQIGKEDIEFINIELGFDLCRIDDVNIIVTGSFIKAGETFVTDMKIFDSNTKRLLKNCSSKGEGVTSILKNQIDKLSKEISQTTGMTGREPEKNKKPIAEITTTSLDAYNYFLRGRNDFYKFYEEDAKKFLEKAIELDTTFAKAYFYLSIINMKLGDYKAGYEARQKAIQCAHKAPEKEKLFIIAFLERDLEKQLQLFKQMLKKYPKEKRVHERIAVYYQYYEGSGSISKAIDHWNKVLELDPNYGRALNMLGYIHADIEDYEKALEFFKEYASVSPGDAHPFNSIGDMYLQMGKLDEAIAKFKEAIEVKPDFFSDLTIAYIYAMLENYDEAIKWVDHRININSSSGLKAEGYALRGFFHYWLGNFNQSQIDFHRSAEMAKSLDNKLFNAYADWVSGWIYFERGELKLSRHYFTKWLDCIIEHRSPWTGRTPDSYKIWYNFYMGLVDLKQGRIDSARYRLHEMELILPQTIPADKHWMKAYNYNTLYAEIWLKEGNIQKAITVYEKVQPQKVSVTGVENMIPYNSIIISDGLARAYYKNGDLDKAITEYERLITFDPNSKDRRLIPPKYHYRLANLYGEKNLLDKAIEQYEKFLEIWKDADENLPEKIDATKRLAKLKQR